MQQEMFRQSLFGRDQHVIAEEQVEIVKERVWLQEYIQVLNRWKWLFGGTFLAVLLFAGLWIVFCTPIYRAEAKLLIENSQRPTPAPLLALGALSGGLLDGMSGLSDSASIETQLERLKSRTIMEPAEKRLGIRDISRIPKVSFENIKGTSIIEVACLSPDSKLALKYVQIITDEYIEQSLKDKRQSLDDALALANKELADATETLKQAEDALAQLHERQGIASVDGETSAALVQRQLAQTEAVNGLKGSVAATRAQVDSLRRELASKHDFVVSTQTIRRNPIVDGLRVQLSDLRAERSKMLEKYQPDSRKVQDIDAKISGIENQLEQEVERVVGEETMVEPLEADLRLQLVRAEVQLISQTEAAAVAEAALAQLQEQVDKLPVQLRRAVSAQREVEIANKKYLALVAHKQDLDVRLAGILPGAVIFESAAIDPKPVKPKKRDALVLAIIMGGMLSVLVVCVANALGDRFNSVKEVERLLRLPVLAIVPRVAPGTPVPIASKVTEPSFRESFRTLCSILSLKAASHPITSAMVVASHVGAGKTTAALNLAIAFAETGRRTILVDANLRCPAIHTALGLNNEVGLAQCIAGTVAPSEALQRIDVDRHPLTVLTAGLAPDNPEALLTSEGAPGVLADLTQRADMVVIDMPGSLLAAVSWIVSESCDAVIPVVDMETTRRSVAMQLVDIIGNNGGYIPGIVTNRGRRPSAARQDFDYSEFHTH